MIVLWIIKIFITCKQIRVPQFTRGYYWKTDWQTNSCSALTSHSLFSFCFLTSGLQIWGSLSVKASNFWGTSLPLLTPHRLCTSPRSCSIFSVSRGSRSPAKTSLHQFYRKFFPSRSSSSGIDGEWNDHKASFSKKPSVYRYMQCIKVLRFWFIVFCILQYSILCFC